MQYLSQFTGCRHICYCVVVSVISEASQCCCVEATLVAVCVLSFALFGHVQCVRCGLLQSVIPGICQSIKRLRCANAAEWIEVVHGVKAVGNAA